MAIKPLIGKLQQLIIIVILDIEEVLIKTAYWGTKGLSKGAVACIFDFFFFQPVTNLKDDHTTGVIFYPFCEGINEFQRSF